MGKIPSVAEYMERVKSIEPLEADIYRYLNFNQLDEYQSIADTVVEISV
jgi:aconitate hydratase 2/2-methylisocitrate dehydratase